MLKIITTTGARPEAWELCQQFMASQNYSEQVYWIIVDDGPVAQEITFDRPGWKLHVVRPEPFWEDGQNTQIRNLQAAIDVLLTIDDLGPLAIIEDDDYYSPNYLTAALNELNGFELVGELNPKYFNCFSRTGKKFIAPFHTSLASTVMTGSAVKTFIEAVDRGKKFVDIDLWGSFEGEAKLYPGENTIGIKRLPGRGGIGQGHDIFFGHPVDPEQWLGEAYKYYKPYIRDEAEAMEVKVIRPFPYAGKYRTAGDVFTCRSQKDFKLLVAMKKVEPYVAPKQGKPAEPKKNPEPKKEEQQQQKKTTKRKSEKTAQKYQRRDMRAE